MGQVARNRVSEVSIIPERIPNDYGEDEHQPNNLTDCKWCEFHSPPSCPSVPIIREVARSIGHLKSCESNEVVPVTTVRNSLPVHP